MTRLAVTTQTTQLSPLPRLTVHIEEASSGRLAGRVHSHHSVNAGILQVSLMDHQGAAVTMEQQLEVAGFLDWCVIMVPYHLKETLSQSLYCHHHISHIFLLSCV